jgi:PAS domain S-box-containing protein
VRNIVNKSKEKYRTIFENTGTATIIVEEDTTISLVNGQFEELSGYSRDEIEWKKSWIEFVIEEDLERMKEFHYSRRKDPESTLRKYEFRFVNKEGNIRDILIVIDVIPKTKKSVASLLDITERKKAEEKLKDSEEKYRYLFDSAQVGLYWSRISDGNFLECNDTFAKLFGYDTREEFLANYNAIEHYINPNARSELLEEIRENKEIKNYEIHVTKRDGTPIWVSISARVFETENRIEGAAINITERKKAEQKLKENTEFTQNVFTAIQDGLSVLDLDLNILSVKNVTMFIKKDRLRVLGVHLLKQLKRVS